MFPPDRAEEPFCPLWGSPPANCCYQDCNCMIALIISSTISHVTGFFFCIPVGVDRLEAFSKVDLRYRVAMSQTKPAHPFGCAFYLCGAAYSGWFSHAKQSSSCSLVKLSPKIFLRSSRFMDCSFLAYGCFTACPSPLLYVFTSRRTKFCMKKAPCFCTML